MNKRESAHWCLVSSRYRMLGIRERVLRDSSMGWSVPSELRRGDLVVMYERGRPSGPGGIKGRKIFPIVARAETDAQPDEQWGHWAEFTAVALEPALTWDDVKEHPVASTWPAFRQRLRGNRGNHLVPEEVWDALIALAERRDPGVAADVDALAAGESPGPRAPTRAVLRHEPVSGDEYEVFENERRIEGALLDILMAAGVARLGTPSDGLPAKRGHGHRIKGHYSYCDLLLILPDGRVVVVEVESVADGDPDHGVLQVVRYRGELAATGRDATACVVAQDFSDLELERARDLNVECFQIIIDAETGWATLMPLDTWHGPLTEEWDGPGVGADDVPYYDLLDPQTAAEFQVPVDGRGVFVNVHWDALALLQDTLGYDITPLRGTLSTDDFEQRYGGWMQQVAKDHGLVQSVSDDALALLAELAPGPETDADDAALLAGARTWTREGAPFCLWYPEVAAAFGVLMDADGLPVPGTYVLALDAMQRRGYDLTPLKGAMSEPVFLARYTDWIVDLIDDWDLRLA